MRTLLPVLMAVFFAPALRSQNAFFDAKRMLDWYPMHNADSAKKASVPQIRQLLENYRQTNPIPKRSWMHRIDSVLDEMEREEIATRMPVINRYNAIVQSYREVHPGNDSFLAKHPDIIAIKKGSARVVTIKCVTLPVLTQLKNALPVQASIEFILRDKILSGISSYPVVTSLLKMLPLTSTVDPNLTTDSISKEIYAFLEKEVNNLLTATETDMQERRKHFVEEVIRDDPAMVEKLVTILGLNRITLTRMQHEERKELVAGNFTDPRHDALFDNGKMNNALADKNFPSQSEIIDALAIYLAGRFKQEVAMTFVENLFKYLNKNSVAREIFPVTWKTLSQDDQYSSPKFGSEWRNSLAKDFIDMPENIVNSSFFKKFGINDTISNFLSDAVSFGKQVKMKHSFVDIIRHFYSRVTDKTNTNPLKSTVVIRAVLAMYVINEEFYDTSARKYWIAPERLARISPNEMGLLSELLETKYGGTFRQYFPAANFSSFTSLVNQTNIRKYSDLLSLLRQFENSQTRLSNGEVKDAFWDMQRVFIDFVSENVSIGAGEKKGLTIIKNAFYIYDYISNRNFGAAVNSLFDILNIALESRSNDIRRINIFLTETSARNFESIGTELDAHSRRLINELEKTTSLLYEVAKQHRATGTISIPNLQIVLADTPFVDQFFTGITGNTNNEFYNAILAKAKTAFENFQGQVYNEHATAALKLMQIKRDKKIFKFSMFSDFTHFMDVLDLSEKMFREEAPQFVRVFRQITGFFVDASAAQNSKELSKVVEMYALPPGSYKTKRRAIVSIDLNAYVGVFYAREKGVEARDSFHSATGITAPVGLSFSWGKARKKPFPDSRKYVNDYGNIRYMRNNAFSIFISLIDIGGPVSYRLSNDSSGGLPNDTKWSQLLAPGIHFAHGIKNTPLCVSAGMQFSPQLRNYKIGDLKSTLRFQLALLVDMPLYNLFLKKTPGY